MEKVIEQTLGRTPVGRQGTSLDGRTEASACPPKTPSIPSSPPSVALASMPFAHDGQSVAERLVALRREEVWWIDGHWPENRRTIWESVLVVRPYGLPSLAVPSVGWPFGVAGTFGRLASWTSSMRNQSWFRSGLGTPLGDRPGGSVPRRRSVASR